MSTVFADTGAWIALLSRDDRQHAAAVHRYRQLVEHGDRLLTTNYVVDETATHLRYRLGLPAALDFRRMLDDAAATGRVRVAWVDERADAQGWQILEKYAAVGLSLTDAVSAAVARAGHITEVFGCDHDFEALGFVVLPGYR